jgi:Zn-dependent protease with chaperone function
MIGWLGIAVSVALVLLTAYRRIRHAHFKLDNPATYPRIQTQLKRLLFASLVAKILLFFTLPGTRSILVFEIKVSLGILLSFGLLMVEVSFITCWLYPLEKYVRRLTSGQWEFVRFRLGLILESFSPLLAGLQALLLLQFFLSGHIRQIPLGHWVALGMVTWILWLSMFFRRRRFLLAARQAPFPFPGMLEEVQRLGREVGVNVREIVVLDGARLRLANAFAVGNNRVAITDYLLASLTERETLAVLAHEVLHLAQHKRVVKWWIAEMVTALVLGILLTPFLRMWHTEWQLLLLLPLVWLALYPMIRLRNRHERDADAFAASHYGPETLKSALLKIAELNPKRSKRAGNQVHPDLAERIAWLDYMARAGLEK